MDTNSSPVRYGLLAKSLRTLICAYADKETYSFDRSVDWQVCPVDIRLSQGVFQKVLQIERASGESVEMEVALGIDTGSTYARTVDRNFHIDLLNFESFASKLEFVDADLDLRRVARLSPDECEPFLSGDAARRVGLWALDVGCKEVLLDTVTLLEHFLAIDSFTACLLLSPLMPPGYEVSISSGSVSCPRGQSRRWLHLRPWCAAVPSLAVPPRAARGPLARRRRDRCGLAGLRDATTLQSADDLSLALKQMDGGIER